MTPDNYEIMFTTTTEGRKLKKISELNGLADQLPYHTATGSSVNTPKGTYDWKVSFVGDVANPDRTRGLTVLSADELTSIRAAALRRATARDRITPQMLNDLLKTVDPKKKDAAKKLFESVFNILKLKQFPEPPVVPSANKKPTSGEKKIINASVDCSTLPPQSSGLVFRWAAPNPQLNCTVKVTVDNGEGSPRQCVLEMGANPDQAIVMGKDGKPVWNPDYAKRYFTDEKALRETSSKLKIASEGQAAAFQACGVNITPTIVNTGTEIH